MYRVLLVETPSYKNEKYQNVKNKFHKNEYDFHKVCLKLKAKISKTFKIKLIGFDKSVKKTYNTFNKYNIYQMIN